MLFYDKVFVKYWRDLVGVCIYWVFCVGVCIMYEV